MKFHKTSRRYAGATLHGTTMYDWGLDEQTGLLTGKVGRSVEADDKWIKNGQGEVAAGSVYNARANFTITGYVTGASLTGAAAAAPGAAITPANETTGQGVTAGLIICRGTSLDRSNEDFVSSNISAVQHSLITT